MGQARKLCSKTNAVRLAAEEVVASAVSRETALGLAAAPYLKEGRPIPDEVLVPLLLEAAGAEECARSGYVLHGVPNSREQAMALQAAGMMATHALLLEAPTALLEDRNAGRVVHPESKAVYNRVFAPPPEEEAEACVAAPLPGLAAAAELYRRNELGLEASYRSVLTRVNGDQVPDDVFAEAWAALCTPRASNAPVTPRVALLGPPGAGQEVQAKELAAKYGLVNVSLWRLLAKAVSGDSAEGASIRICLREGQPVPDSIAFGLVRARLAQLDCQTQGWALTGFPRTVPEAKMLAAAGFGEVRAFVLDLSEGSAKDRLTLRRTDPVTGARYHLGTNPPPDAVAARLVTHPRDEPAAVDRDWAHWADHAEALKAHFDIAAGRGLIDASLEEHAVKDAIDAQLVRPQSDGVAF